VVTRRMESDSKSLVLEDRRDYVESASGIVPDTDSLIFTASDNKLLTDADIHACHRLRVEVANHVIETGGIFGSQIQRDACFKELVVLGYHINAILSRSKRH